MVVVLSILESVVGKSIVVLNTRGNFIMAMLLILPQDQTEITQLHQVNLKYKHRLKKKIYYNFIFYLDQ